MHCDDKNNISNHTYKVGNSNFIQVEGAPIGLDLTQALSRPFMIRWDRLYLKKVDRAGVDMQLYKRYVDDSNQVGIVPPPGSEYCPTTKKLIYNQDIIMMGEPDDKRLASILKDIANDVQVGIVMEDDYPSKNINGHLAILDMEVRTDEETGHILYRHYEKPMASKLVLHSSSAQS